MGLASMVYKFFDKRPALLADKSVPVVVLKMTIFPAKN